MAGDIAQSSAIVLPFAVPDDWLAPILDTCCEFIKDGDWVELKDQGGSDYRLLQISNIGVGEFRETGNYRWITQETFDRLRCTQIMPDDVLVARMPEPTGRAWFVKDLAWPSITAVDVAIIRTRSDELDPRFLAYCINSPSYLALIDSLTTGTTRRRIRRADIQRLRIPKPPIKEQQAIARILGTLDDKIELNRRMNETLEGMARAIFKSWFVDFDPVRAKAEGEQPSGLAPHIADLFSDAFEASELGEIPKGWKVRPIGDIVKAVGGGTPSTKNPAYWDEGTHCFATPKDLSGLSSPMLLDTGRRVTNAGLAKISSGLLPVGTVLLSSRAPVGYLAIAQIPICVNQGFIAMICNGPVSNYYVLNWAKVNMPEIKRHASGTTFAEISKRSFRPILALVPSQEVMTAFNIIVEPVYAKIQLNLEASRILAALRDTLLPKLISGELRVPDAERIIEGVYR